MLKRQKKFKQIRCNECCLLHTHMFDCLFSIRMILYCIIFWGYIYRYTPRRYAPAAFDNFSDKTALAVVLKWISRLERV